MNTDAQTSPELDLWERDLDAHLHQCPICREDVDRYCSVGQEMVHEVTMLLLRHVPAVSGGGRDGSGAG